MTRPSVGTLIPVGAVGTAEAGDVLTGKTFSSEPAGVEAEGSMPNRGAHNITPGTSSIAIPAGYHNGSGRVSGDQNLKVENIKEGVTIFGVAGTMPDVEGNAVAADVRAGKTFSSVAAGIGVSGTFVMVKKVLRGGPLSLQGKEEIVIPISTVDPNKCYVRVESAGGTSKYTHNAGYELTATQLKLFPLSHVGDNSYYAHTIYWQIVEFGDLKSIQHGNISLRNGSDGYIDVAINPVNLDKAFSIVDSYGSDSNLDNYHYVAGTLLNSTTLRIYGKSGTSYYSQALWTVIEFP